MDPVRREAEAEPVVHSDRLTGRRRHHVGQMARKKREEPRTLVLSFRLRPGTTRREANVVAGIVAAAVDDAAGAYRAMNGASPFDGGRAVVSADLDVVTLH